MRKLISAYVRNTLETAINHSDRDEKKDKKKRDWQDAREIGVFVQAYAHTLIAVWESTTYAADRTNGAEDERWEVWAGDFVRKCICVFENALHGAAPSLQLMQHIHSLFTFAECKYALLFVFQ